MTNLRTHLPLVLGLGLAAWTLTGCTTGGGGDEGGDHADHADHEHADHDEAGEMDHDHAHDRATATLEARSGSSLTGTVTFTAEGGKITLVAEVSGVEPGEHAIHIHAVGDCSADDATSAGGHWNPTGHDHGKWGEAPFHLGDIGNIHVGDNGTGSITLTTDKWTIGDGGDRDIAGKSVIVHAGADDFESQPSGAAGGRIGCGVIEVAH